MTDVVVFAFGDCTLALIAGLGVGKRNVDYIASVRGYGKGFLASAGIPSAYYFDV